MLFAFLRCAVVLWGSPVRVVLFSAFSVFLWTDLAGAQTLSFENQSVRVRRQNERDADQDPLAINRQDCLDDVPGEKDYDVETKEGERTWMEMSARVSGSVPRNAVLEVWASRGADCSDNQERLNTGNCWRVDRRDARNQQIITAVVRPRVVIAREDITTLDKDDPENYPSADVCDSNIDDPHTFSVFLINGDQIVSELTWTDTRVDLVAPDAPALFNATPGDGNIFLDWEIDSEAEDPDTEGFAFFCTEASSTDSGGGGAGGAGGTPCGQDDLVEGEFPPGDSLLCGSSRGQGTRRGQIRNLDNDKIYAVAMSATDFLGNPGSLSQVRCLQPAEVETFFERYQDAGGQGGGGFCSLSPRPRGGLLLFLLGLGAAVVVLRRHRRQPPGRSAGLALLGLGGLFLFSPDLAHAHQEDDPIGYTPRYVDPANDPADLRSPRSGAFEFRVGPYFFGIDREFDGATPFADAFGDKPGWAFGLEGDWQVLRIPHFGSLGPGLGWHYVQRSTTAEFVDPPVDDDGREIESAHPDRLWMMPMFAVAVLRVDVFKEDFSVPLVPYAKFGFALNLWEARDARRVSEVNDIKGRGLETGWTLHLGGMLHLNPLAPQSVADMDASTGVNDAYLFVEWWYSDVDSFGQGLQSGSNTLSAGITLEF